MKKKFLIIFLISTVSSFLVWSGIYSVLNQVAPYETLQIFISLANYQTNLPDYLLEELSAYPLKKIQIVAVDDQDSLFVSSFQTAGILDSDILILPASFLNTLESFDDFAIFNNQVLQDFHFDSENTQFYQRLNKKYGVCLFSKIQNVHVLDSYLNFKNEETYFALINKNTYNSGEQSRKTTNVTSNSFYALAHLLNLDN